jgi:hypothetical protein
MGSLLLPLPMGAGHMCRCASALPGPSQWHPRARPVLVVLARRWLPPRQPESTGPDLSPYVANACFERFSCFRCMFQVFHMDVVKIDRDVASVSECRCFVDRLVNYTNVALLQEDNCSIQKDTRSYIGSGRSPTSSLRDDRVRVPRLNALKFLQWGARMVKEVGELELGDGLSE